MAMSSYLFALTERCLWFLIGTDASMSRTFCRVANKMCYHVRHLAVLTSNHFLQSPTMHNTNVSTTAAKTDITVAFNWFLLNTNIDLLKNYSVNGTHHITLVWVMQKCSQKCKQNQQLIYTPCSRKGNTKLIAKLSVTYEYFLATLHQSLTTVSLTNVGSSQDATYMIF